MAGGSASSGEPGALTLLASQEKEKGGENQVHRDYQENRDDDSRRCGAAHLLGPCTSDEAFVTANCRNRQAKHETFHQTANDIPQEKSVRRRIKVAQER